MKLAKKMKLIAACIAFVTATQVDADSKQRISAGSVKGKVNDRSVWTTAANAYAETVKQMQTKEGKQ